MPSDLLLFPTRRSSDLLPFYFLHLGMSNERIGVPTVWKFDNRSFGALGCGSHIRWEYAVMQGSKFFAETIKAYGVSHLFFVPRSEEHTSELQSHSDLVCPLIYFFSLHDALPICFLSIFST